VIGALRARAAWLGAVGGLGEDQRFANPTWQSPAELNPVRRLFGVTGWRGLLRIARMSPIGADEPRNLTGIALDRFSGAVLDGAIFVHEMFIGVRFELDLVLDGRQFSYVGPSGKVVEDYPFASDTALFKALLLDIWENGLMLGHGTNRGFGWFEAEKS